jgi:hypothetical protein
LFSSVLSALIIFIVARRCHGRGLVETTVSIAIVQFLVRFVSFYHCSIRPIPREAVLVGVDYCSQVTHPPQTPPAILPS